MNPVKVAVSGRGAMAESVKELAASRSDMVLVSLGGADVIIDFSSPQTALGLKQYNVPLVIGTTGFTPPEEAELLKDRRDIVLNPNFSSGMEWLLDHLEGLSDWETEITETHSPAKKDSPSGTAKILQESIGGTITSKREEVPYIGRHKITLEKDGEIIEVVHTVLNRRPYAEGALNAALALVHNHQGDYPRKCYCSQ